MVFIAMFLVLFLIASIVIIAIQKRMEADARRSILRRKGVYNGDYREEQEEYYKENIAPVIRTIKLITYGALIGLMLVITVLNSFFIVSEQEVAATMTFGKTATVEGAGLKFKLPFFTRVYKEDGRTQSMAIGYDPKSNESIEADSLMITSDFNFVNIDFNLEYRITDAIEYNFGSDNPEGILYNIAMASARNTVGLHNIDSVITTGKPEIQASIKEQIIEKLEMHSTGLSIVNVTIQDAEPPTTEVEAAFNAVEDNKQRAETAINNAKKYEKEKIPNAEAEADNILRAAEATKTERINQATQEVAEFNALYQEYRKNPETVKKQLYYSALEEILPEMEIIVGSDSKVVYIKNGQIETN